MKKIASLKTFFVTFCILPFLIGMLPLSVKASTPPKKGAFQKKPEKRTLQQREHEQRKQVSWRKADVLPGIVVVKYKEGYLQGITQAPQSVKALGVITEKKLCGKLPVSAMLTKKGESLARIRVLSYASGEDPKAVAEKLSKDETVEYAEPYFVRRIFYTPNDPYYATSWWLQTIQAAQAWEVTKGDTSVIIGIVDTGVQWDHPDLAANIKRNWAEVPNDGIDNDANGYVDDVVGWDFGSASNIPGSGGTGDNNPDERAAIHGTHCAGIAGAVTGNSTGVASVGFNSKILPVKASVDSDQNNGIYYGYEGILYAAERGAKIISCSWGGDGYSEAEQDIIDYVTEVKGALVVAAAGNGGTDAIGDNIDTDPIYPAAYNNVLAVGATNQNDVKVTFSNYGATACDLMAPGLNILSTSKQNAYTSMSGTSMACPMVAGSAALVAARFPNYTPEQIGEQLRATADNIDAKNLNYIGKLGKGRLSIYNALTVSNPIAVRLSDVELTDIDGDGYLAAGDTVNVKMTIRNVLSPVSGVSVTVTPQSANVTMLQNSFTVSSLGTLVNYTDQTVRFIVDGSVALDETIEFEVAIAADGGYNGSEQFSATVQSSYLNLAASGSNVELTVNNRGNLGFNDYPDNRQGIGLLYRGNSTLFEGALMIGTSATTIEDVARETSGQSADFAAKVPVKKVNDAPPFLETRTTFSDSPVSIDRRLGVEISEHVYLFPTPPDTSFAILGYVIRNTSGKTLTNLHVGLLMDWDVVEYAKNSSGYDAATRTLFSFHPQTNVHAGVTSLGKIAGAECDAVSSLNSMDDQKKWNVMSGGVQTVTLQNTDVISFLSSGPFQISAGDSIAVGFGLVFGMGQNALLQNAALATQKWTEISQVLKVPGPVAAFRLIQNYPNPFNPATTIEYEIPETVKNPVQVKLRVYDILGRHVATLVNEVQAAGRYQVSFNGARLASGVYFYQLQAGSFVKAKKMVLVK